MDAGMCTQLTVSNCGFRWLDEIKASRSLQRDLCHRLTLDRNAVSNYHSRSACLQNRHALNSTGSPLDIAIARYKPIYIHVERISVELRVLHACSSVEHGRANGQRKATTFDVDERLAEWRVQ